MEAAFDKKTLEKAMVPIDEYINKGATSDLPSVRKAAENHSGVAPADRDDAAPRRARLKASDFV